MRLFPATWFGCIALSSGFSCSRARSGAGGSGAGGSCAGGGCSGTCRSRFSRRGSGSTGAGCGRRSGRGTCRSGRRCGRGRTCGRGNACGGRCDGWCKVYIVNPIDKYINIIMDRCE